MNVTSVLLWYGVSVFLVFTCRGQAVTVALWVAAASVTGVTAAGDCPCVVQLNGTNLGDSDTILLCAAGCGTESEA